MPRVNLFVEVVAGGLTQPVVLPRSVKWVPAYSWQGHCTSGATALPEMMQPAATGWIWNSNTTNYPEVTERTCPWSGFISQITSSCIITRHYLFITLGTTTGPLHKRPVMATREMKDYPNICDWIIDLYNNKQRSQFQQAVVGEFVPHGVWNI